jgi:hypothetical protein
MLDLLSEEDAVVAISLLINIDDIRLNCVRLIKRHGDGNRFAPVCTAVLTSLLNLPR